MSNINIHITHDMNPNSQLPQSDTCMRWTIERFQEDFAQGGRINKVGQYVSGWTPDELVQIYADGKNDSPKPNVTHLHQAGVLVETGEKRETSRDHYASVYKLVPEYAGVTVDFIIAVEAEYQKNKRKVQPKYKGEKAVMVIIKALMSLGRTFAEAKNIVAGMPEVMQHVNFVRFSQMTEEGWPEFDGKADPFVATHFNLKSDKPCKLLSNKNNLMHVQYEDGTKEMLYPKHLTPIDNINVPGGLQ